jgi:cysteinyl-tRNA synthetase
LADLDDMLRGADAVPAGNPPQPAGRTGVGARDAADAAVTSVREEADRARLAFDTALARRDVPGCVSVVLGLEAAITAWRADTLQSDDVDEARRVLRALVVRLGELATDGVRDPRERIGPYVDLLLDLRTSARDARDFATSDLVRDRLGALGVEVRDTPTGATWDVNDV